METHIYVNGPQAGYIGYEQDAERVAFIDVKGKLSDFYNRA